MAVRGEWTVATRGVVGVRGHDLAECSDPPQSLQRLLSYRRFLSASVSGGRKYDLWPEEEELELEAGVETGVERVPLELLGFSDLTGRWFVWELPEGLEAFLSSTSCS